MIQNLLENLYEKYKNNNDGNVATYIPELANADIKDFGIAIVTSNGKVFEVGDSRKEFTIQSISKPFTYGEALRKYGEAKILSYVGVQPTDEAFNSIELEPITNRPFNPMINAGAISITGLLFEKYGDETMDTILSIYSKAAGRALSINNEVYKSEWKSGHRNRAISYLLVNFNMMTEQVEKVLDLYFKQCSISLNSVDLATIGATLANIGTNPITNEEVFDVNQVRHILSIMFGCGMYNNSGHWAHEVGLPAKSGVSGGILAAVNRQLGIATYSPPLDFFGNSVRGIKVYEDLSKELGLHVFDSMNEGSNFLRAIIEA